MLCSHTGLLMAHSCSGAASASTGKIRWTADGCKLRRADVSGGRLRSGFMTTDGRPLAPVKGGTIPRVPPPIRENGRATDMKRRDKA